MDNIIKKEIRALFCINTPAQAHTWRYVIEDLMRKGHKAKILARDYGFAPEILKKAGLPVYTLPSTSRRYLCLFEIMSHLQNGLMASKGFAPTIVVGFGVDAALTAALLRKPCIIFTDSEPIPIQHFIFQTSWILFKDFFRRIWAKYLRRPAVNLNNLDFTLNKYEQLCRTIKESKYESITFGDYLQQGKRRINRPYIIMRHDIDRSPQRALDAAQVEHKYGICATYYFRVQRGTYIPDIMDKIASYGHEIGYHYETIDKCKGNLIMAQALFKKELNDFQKRYDVKTVCAHGNPLTRHDNKDIWKSMELSDFKLLGEAFMSLDYNQFAYFSDSGRTWLNTKSQKMPGKDSVETAFNKVIPKSTDDVIKIIRDGEVPNICILSHPERWSKDIAGFISRYLLDRAFNWGKIIITISRKNGPKIDETNVIGGKYL